MTWGELWQSLQDAVDELIFGIEDVDTSLVKNI